MLGVDVWGCPLTKWLARQVWFIPGFVAVFILLTGLTAAACGDEGDNGQYDQEPIVFVEEVEVPPYGRTVPCVVVRDDGWSVDAVAVDCDWGAND